MRFRVKHEGAYTNGHSYSRVVDYDVQDAPKKNDEDWYEWWEEFLFEDTGDNVTEPGVGSWYSATILKADDQNLVNEVWEWTD